MRCPQCQAQNPEDARFCEECGARLALACPQCGAEIGPGKKFCRSCGTALSGRVPDRPLSPATYTPKHLAEKILTSKATLEGERKQVTVLFADVKGSMELLADRDPEEARKLLDPVLERMMEAVHRYEGTVNQVMGDGIMALFGAPLAHEDHAVRACYAALRMQESVAQYAEGVFRSHGVPLQIRVGLNSGEVVVRAIGSDLHMDYTAVGQTTHLAARMEQMATPGTILLGQATLQLAEGFVQVTARGPVAVKGLPHPVDVYVLTGASALRSRLHAAAARGFTRFVGRDTEIEQLRRTLGLAHDGHGQLVAVVGEPGVGKSRLVYEFTHSHRTQDWLILEAGSGSVSYGKATSYLPVIDLLKAYFRVHDRETHREIREKVTGKLLTLDHALEPIQPALLALLDVPVEDARWQALDPAQRRQRTLEAVRHLLLRESHTQPVLLVFEDLHWIDAETQALLDGLVEGLPTARLLLLVNYRPEYQHGWGSKTYYSQLRLDALPPESTGDLLQVLLGDDPTLVPLKHLLIKRGNPLFIEESIRTLVETGALVGERGAYRPTRPIQAIEVPATVQVILAARIDRLSPEDKQLLQTAAVIGKDVPLVLLHAVAEAAEEAAVQRGLTHLQAAEFLYATHLFPDPEYTFKHALTHEVTYGTLLQERRVGLHTRIVQAIEALYPDRLTEHVDRLARHAFEGHVWSQAVRYCRQAGVRAYERSAYAEAAAAFQRAIDALAHLPETLESARLGIDIRLELRHPATLLKQFDKVSQGLREAERLARLLSDARRLGWVLSFLAEHYRLVYELGHALSAAEHAMNIATTVADPDLRVVANLYLGQVCSTSGDYQAAARHLRANVEALQGDLSRRLLGFAGPPSIISRSWLARSLAELGEFAEGVTIARDGLRIAEQLTSVFALVHVCSSSGTVHLLRGDLDAAIPLLERALALAREHIPLSVTGGVAYLGYAYARRGRLPEALALLTEAVERAPSEALTIRHLGEGHLLAGRRDEAMRLALSALEVSRRQGARGGEAWTLHLLGVIAASALPAEAATAAARFHEAAELAGTLGMRPLVAHCHLGLGKLYRRTGDEAKAKEHLTTAATLYREMGMSFWLEKADAELRGIDR